MYVLICDDEPAFGRKVEQMTREYFAARGLPLETVLWHPGRGGAGKARARAVPAALLDVDLETTNGIALGRQLKQANPDVVLVYISAYLEFAPEGYTVHAFRYLLKRDIERTLPLCLEAVLAGALPKAGAPSPSIWAAARGAAAG